MFRLFAVLAVVSASSVEQTTDAPIVEAAASVDEVGASLRRRPTFKPIVYDAAGDDEGHVDPSHGLNPFMVHYGEEAVITREGDPLLIAGMVVYSLASIVGQYNAALYLYELYNYYFGPM